MLFQGAYVQASPMQAVHDAVKALAQASGAMERRKAIQALEAAALQNSQAEQPLTHHFTDGLYAREILNPKGSLIVTQTHKEHNFSFVMRGHLLVITEDGQKELKAPAWFQTKPGTKRVLYALEETVLDRKSTRLNSSH